MTIATETRRLYRVSDLARAHGVTEEAIHKAERDGRIPLAHREPGTYARYWIWTPEQFEEVVRRIRS